MGLDIFINTDNDDALRTPEYFGNEDHFRNSHRVSRSFCDLMCRQNVISGEPELDQVGRIAGVDIEPLYEMERYISQDDAELMIEFSGQTVGEVSRNEMTNISKVITTVSTLIEKLSVIENLPDLLNDNGYDTLGHKEYFGNFNAANNGSYINNNFGQDLRNMNRFLEYAKGKGVGSVYFTYG